MIDHLLNQPHPLLRQGDTGIGYTLETLLGIEENNLPLPDLNNIEIKTKKLNSKAMTTLFCYGNKSNFLIPLKDTITTYGYQCNNRTQLYTTITNKTNNLGFNLRETEHNIIIANNNTDIISWDKQLLQERFIQKIPKLLLVYAKKHKQTVTFTDYTLYDNTKEIGQLLTDGLISIDIRCWYDGTKVRDRGIAFRTKTIERVFSPSH